MRKSVHLSLPPNTHNKVMDYARHIGAVSTSDTPMAATAVWKTLRMIIGYYGNEEIMEKVEQEGGDLLSFVNKCVRKELKK